MLFFQYVVLVLAGPTERRYFKGFATHVHITDFEESTYENSELLILQNLSLPSHVKISREKWRECGVSDGTIKQNSENSFGTDGSANRTIISIYILISFLFFQD